VTTYYMPIPEQHFEAMLEHLLWLTRGAPEPRSGAERIPSMADPEAEVDLRERDQQFEAVWPDLRADQRQFYFLLAGRPGEDVPFQPDVATALGGAREAQNALISLTKRMKRNHVVDGDWFVEVKRDERGYIYKMDPDLARVVLRLWDESSS
jgi:hypothetical protein